MLLAKPTISLLDVTFYMLATGGRLVAKPYLVQLLDTDLFLLMSLERFKFYAMLPNSVAGIL